MKLSVWVFGSTFHTLNRKHVIILLKTTLLVARRYPSKFTPQKYVSIFCNKQSKIFFRPQYISARSLKLQCHIFSVIKIQRVGNWRMSGVSGYWRTSHGDLCEVIKWPHFWDETLRFLNETPFESLTELWHPSDCIQLKYWADNDGQ